MDNVIGTAIHRCLHVLDLEKSLDFYNRALGMTEIRRMGPDDGSWTNVFIGNDACGFQLELTWNKGRIEPYDNGGRDSHIAFTVPDFEAARQVHEAMGCICHVNEKMGLYFIEDPDGCWIEILPQSRKFEAQSGIDVLSAMEKRRSVRKYADEPVSDEAMNRILEAGLLSASGMAKRPWELIVVTDREILSTLASCREHGSAMLDGAAAAIAVFGNSELSDTWIEDCSIVMANMHLESSANALGSCWIQGRGRTASDGRSTEEFVREILDVPENLKLEAILSIGIPAQPVKARELEDSLCDKIHHDRFQSNGAE